MAQLVIPALLDATARVPTVDRSNVDAAAGEIVRQDAVLSQASHELKAPLTALRANIQLGERRLESLLSMEATSSALAQGMGEIQELLGRAKQYVALEDRLASDLGDLAYIEMGKLEIQLVATDLVAIVRDAVEGQRLAWPSRIIRLDAPSRGIPVLADRDRILQAVTNYLMNALKYSQDHLPVEVRVRAGAKVGRVSVRDHGMGLPARERKRVWERFYRAEGVKVLSGPAASLGLGLYISRSIVRQHRGKVGVRSTPGQGATFWLTLPLLALPGVEQVSR
jgi:signal transduction histidine kinase